MVRLVSHQDVRDRQALILDDRMRQLNVLIAGAGMVGSWVALAMVRAVGGTVHVWDDDVVEEGNVGVQAYDGAYVGHPKVDALAKIATDPPIRPHMGRFPGEYAANSVGGLTIGEHQFPVEDTVVICAVDSMAGRRAIAEWSRDNGIPLFIETGVQAELVVVKTCTKPEDYERYLLGLPGDDDVEDAQCGLKGTAYAGMSLASQIVPLVNRWCKGDTLPPLRLFHTGFFMELPPPDEAAGEEAPAE